MRQYYSGRKVQNWHRPLGQNELGQRYRRLVYADPMIEQRGSSIVYNDPPETRDFGECRKRPCSSCENLCFYVDREAYRYHSLMSDLENAPTRILFTVREKAGNDAESALGNAPVQRFSQPQYSLEWRLAEYTTQFLRINHETLSLSRFDEWLAIIRDLASSPTRQNIIRSFTEREKHPELTELIYLFSPFWIRSPESWDPQETDLISHLFVAYRIPHFLRNAWRQSYRNTNWQPMRVGAQSVISEYWWIWLFILIGQGGSLRKAAKLLGWNIPAKSQHYLSEDPDIHPFDAFLYARLRSLGASECEYRRLGYMRASFRDAIECCDESMQRFWESAIRWLVRNRDSIRDDQTHMILDWAYHEFASAEQDRAKTFTILARSPRKALELSFAYDMSRRQPATWNGIGLNAEILDADGRNWSFVELTSAGQMKEEGRSMKHCAATYVDECASGQSAIVSVTCDRIRRVTVHFDLRSHCIWQIRGMRNRNASKEEMIMVEKWLHDVVSKVIGATCRMSMF